MLAIVVMHRKYQVLVIKAQWKHWRYSLTPSSVSTNEGPKSQALVDEESPNYVQDELSRNESIPVTANLDTWWSLLTDKEISPWLWTHTQKWKAFEMLRTDLLLWSIYLLILWDYFNWLKIKISYMKICRMQLKF